MEIFEVISLIIGTGVFGVVLDIKFKLGGIIATHDDHERRLEKLENIKC